MASIEIKGHLLKELETRARLDRRTLRQEAIVLLEQALQTQPRRPEIATREFLKLARP